MYVDGSYVELTVYRYDCACQTDVFTKLRRVSMVRVLIAGNRSNGVSSEI